MMEMVRCLECGNTGYTASPESVRCSKCGGRHEVVKTDRVSGKTTISVVGNYLRGLARSNFKVYG